MENPLPDRQPLGRIHDIGDLDLLGAFDRARIARRAEPGRVAVQDLAFEPPPDHPDDLPRRIVHVLAERAGPAAGPALDAAI